MWLLNLKKVIFQWKKSFNKIGLNSEWSGTIVMNHKQSSFSQMRTSNKNRKNVLLQSVDSGHPALMSGNTNGNLFGRNFKYPKVKLGELLINERWIIDTFNANSWREKHFHNLRKPRSLLLVGLWRRIKKN